jgi:hypothetical protein
MRMGGTAVLAVYPDDGVVVAVMANPLASGLLWH